MTRVQSPTALSLLYNHFVKEAAISVIRTLREHGHEAYLVGGCVRDLLLGREPADYDVSTNATPREVMRIFPETYAVGEQFGVVLIPIDGLTAKDLARSRQSRSRRNHRSKRPSTRPSR